MTKNSSAKYNEDIKNLLEVCETRSAEIKRLDGEVRRLSRLLKHVQDLNRITGQLMGEELGERYYS